MDKKETAQGLYKRLKKAYNDLHELYDFCYKNDSNDVWDAEHDALLYELEGVWNEIEDFMDEFRDGNWEVDGWNDGWRRQIEDIERANNRLNNYREATIMVDKHKPTYTYC